jgi:hypothetical protein
LYLAIVLAFMLILPLLSSAAELALRPPVPAPVVLAKWFVFWGVGVRLVLAGVRQILQPRFIAETILGIKGDDALIVIRELGFANVAIGMLGIVSILLKSWLSPALVAGAVFYGLAGINHAREQHRSRNENIAMVSDLGFALVLVLLGIAALQ